jgi:hypothetical protein
MIETKGASTAVSACLATLVLTACAGHTHSLVQEGSDREIAAGTFRHEGPEGSSMALEFRGTRFEASGFAIERNQNLAELKRSYGIDRKHWDRIASGLDTDHFVYTAKPELVAGSGERLRCSAVWRSGGSPAGECVAPDGVRVNFRFE